MIMRLHHPLIERWVRAKPTRAVHVTFLGGNLVEVSNESTGVVSGFPGVLNPQLIRLLLEVAAHTEQREIERKAKAVEPVLQRIGGADARRPPVRMTAATCAA